MDPAEHAPVVTLAASGGSHSHTTQACSNAERANASTAPGGSSLPVTASKSSTYSPSSAFQAASDGSSVASEKPAGAGCA